MLSIVSFYRLKLLQANAFFSFKYRIIIILAIFLIEYLLGLSQQRLFSKDSLFVMQIYMNEYYKFIWKKKLCYTKKMLYPFNTKFRMESSFIIVLLTSRTQIISYHVHYNNRKILCRDKYIYFSLIIII